MLHSVANYFHVRRRGINRAAGYIGGAYLLGQYVLGRLEDVRDRLMQDRMARENLRRRFEQNQQDVDFTIMALLPTLGKYILEGMDVEGVTYELQSYSKATRPHIELQPPAPPSESSLASSMELLLKPAHDDRSENGSLSVISSAHENGSPSELSSSSSWIDHSLQVSQASAELVSPISNSRSSKSPDSRQEADLSESMVSSSTTSGSSVAQDILWSPGSARSEIVNPVTRSKADLWKEVKILTFTRTLTIIYSITLLSIFTHIQLNILGRLKYIQSVVQAEREERRRERVQQDVSMLLAGVEEALSEENEDVDEDEDEIISEETERKYLTLSWWILHVGWKDVGERVRRGVEEVFEGVSLKTKFTIQDLFRLVSDVRRRVEYEVTFEGRERRIDFLSTLLPPTSETLTHVLIQGGIPSRLAGTADPHFDALLAETRIHLQSASFQRVLEVCLDRATEVLFDGLRKHVFHSAASESGLDERDEEMRERLAAMLPGLARWCHLALEGLPNELVDHLANVREMSAFSAIIYSNYDDRFR
ncbi:uncharacterized protein LAESUDRAFT_724066 [Laetiporus sulphureus 93-53]|uniref:Peroxin-3 n=1 Tax=Laetiporus sulphureus 93-53 TaxID=1314785 RepID=A0A165EZZ7_9APHY|nr:uncharacterized protein LAESUDRAFT_724066 [Laetiporus sulphureus 93-53]KZT08080.1 hypothetical protein LAESUDRAFT_724066 [Laetiporus sulphureus 93-53]